MNINVKKGSPQEKYDCSGNRKKLLARVSESSSHLGDLEMINKIERSLWSRLLDSRSWKNLEMEHFPIIFSMFTVAQIILG